MPLVANSNLPTYQRLRDQGVIVLDPERAHHQHIRVLHIGLLNMMPDTALAATERQFFRLIGESNPIAQIHMHPFSLPELPRSKSAAAYVAEHYETFEQIKEKGLDGLIISGANVTEPDLSAEVFWNPLIEVIAWATENATSILCSCLTTHAVMQFRYGVKRQHLPSKCWGVFNHRLVDADHPLVRDVNTRFDVPQSRFNEVTQAQFESAGLRVLAASEESGVQLAVSEDGFRMVFFQGHPEYDAVSLLKEYKREVIRFAQKEIELYPPFPAHYFGAQTRAIFDEYQERLTAALEGQTPLPEFPETLVLPTLDNTWHDTGEAIVGNWMGLLYQITHRDRNKPFMEGIDPQNPLNL